MERRRIGRFDVEGVLGQGGMGVVYVARDALLDRRVALKVLPPGHESDAADRHRLLREARSAAALSHPNVVTVLEAGEDAGAVYLAMELVEGGTLAERLGRGPMTQAEVVHVGLGIARGLASAHASGVLHRDLKPANVILGPELTPKLVDFGLARAPARSSGPEERLSFTGVVVGTPGYMAPEQVRGGETDARTDVFALGVVLHEMWSGAPPFGASGLAAMSAVLYDEPAALELGRPGAPAELRELIGRCLCRDPAGRPPDASWAVRVLGALAARLPRAGAPVESPLPQPRAQAFAPTLEVLRSSVRPRASLSSLVGREREILEVEAALEAGARLVTIAGPPGIGKTRVAGELARRASERGRRSVSVTLVGAKALADVEAAVYAALRRTSSETPLVELLALEDALLLVDGGEALAEVLGPLLESWMRIASRMQVVLSSRAVLRAPSEQVVTLAPLPEAVGVELFLARSRQARPTLVVDTAVREAAVEIVRLLDGNPLALTLAAARAAVLSPPQIATRLRERAHDRLSLLQERGSAGLADAIAWSFQLLTPGARALVEELSVLAGPFDVEAAEAIARDPAGVIEGLERLRDASLVRAGPEQGDTVRMMVDPNVRAFAARELERRGDAGSVREAHANHFGALAERALTGPGSATQAAAIAHLDLLDVVALATRASAASTRAAGLRAATLLALHGETHDTEGLEASLVRLLEVSDGVADVGFTLRARAALGLARARGQRDTEGAVRAAREALAQAVAAGDGGLVHRARLALVDSLVASAAIAEASVEASAALAGAPDVDAEIDALERAATVAWRQSALDRALAHMRRALALVEARRDRRRQAAVLHTMGIVCVQQGRFAEARAAYERARELGRAEGATLLVATLANNLGVIHHEQDRLDEAHAAFDEAARDARAGGRAKLFAVARGNLAFIDQEQGRNAEARLGLDEAIATLEAVGDRRYRAAYTLARAALLADEGDAERARADVAAAREMVLPSPEPQVAVLVAVRADYVEHALAHDPEERAGLAVRLRAHLAELERPGSISSQSDLVRMALRLVRRRLG